MKLILLFNVIPVDSKAVQRFTSSLIPSEKKHFGCFFNQVYTAPMTSLSDENLLTLRASFFAPGGEFWNEPKSHVPYRKKVQAYLTG
jgi:hypothetical protein